MGGDLVTPTFPCLFTQRFLSSNSALFLVKITQEPVYLEILSFLSSLCSYGMEEAVVDLGLRHSQRNGPHLTSEMRLTFQGLGLLSGLWYLFECSLPFLWPLRYSCFTFSNEIFTLQPFYRIWMQCWQSMSNLLRLGSYCGVFKKELNDWLDWSQGEEKKKERKSGGQPAWKDGGSDQSSGQEQEARNEFIRNQRRLWQRNYREFPAILRTFCFLCKWDGCV